MKTLSRCGLLVVVLLSTLASGGRLRAGETVEAPKPNHREASEAYQTVFYAVLEGCFADGLTDTDVDQILLREGPDKPYLHFIYACPICTATAAALECYRARPVVHLKIESGKLTFGTGLPAAMHARLYSADLKERLAAIHDLEESWVSRRIDSLRLKPEELAHVQTQLKAAREDGMRTLQAFLEQGTAKYYAPAYQRGDECALCNAAAGMQLKLAAPSANP